MDTAFPPCGILYTIEYTYGRRESAAARRKRLGGLGNDVTPLQATIVPIARVLAAIEV